jgi:hypothetical protein
MAFAMLKPGESPRHRRRSLSAFVTGSTLAPSCVWGPRRCGGGLGKRDACDACGEPILTTQVEYEFMVDKDVTYHFHMSCARMWQAELARRGVA